MPLLQVLISAILGIIFIVFVFLLSWYIALPLLIIWFIGSVFRVIFLKIKSYRLKKEQNGCSIHQTHRHKKSTSTVIDVDYTEVS